MGWLCRNTALHIASKCGHTEKAMALVKAGADVHCKNSYGCGVWLARDSHARAFGSLVAICDRLHAPRWRFILWLCRNTAMYFALPCKLETALELVEAGADVHGKDNDGCGF